MEYTKKQNLTIRILSAVFAVAMMALIFALSAQQGSDSDRVSIGFSEWLFGRGHDFSVLINGLVRAAAHIFEYAVLAFFVFMFLTTVSGGPVTRILLTWIFCLIYAATDEIHQYFVPGRACQLSDIFNDSFGSLICAIALNFFFLGVYRHRAKESAQAKKEAGYEVLNTFSCYMNNEKPGPDCVPRNVYKYFYIARIHRILPMVFDSLCRTVDMKKIGDFYYGIKKEVFADVASQTMRTERFLSVYKKFTNEGLAPLCIKGLSCRVLYPNPDLRWSADEDIIIKADEFEKYRVILENDGFVCISDSTDGDEVTFVERKNGLMLEVHKKLFPDEGVYSGFNSVLSGLFDSPVEFKFENTGFFRPDDSNFLLYLILHAFKHFLIGGVGIRQVADIASFIKSENPNLPFVYEKCAVLNADGFFNAILLVCIKYFNVDRDYIFSQLPKLNENLDTDSLVEDIMSGGIYGKSNNARIRSGSFTFNMYTKSMHRNDSQKKMIMPSYKTMSKKYSYLKKHKWLLPAAYVQRAFTYFNTDYSSQEVLNIGKRRSKTLEKYGVFNNKNAL